MTLQNKETGDTLELPPPDEMGASVIRINGEIVERLLYSDEGSGSVTVASSGQVFSPSGSYEFTQFVIGKLAKLRGKEL